MLKGRKGKVVISSRILGGGLIAVGPEPVLMFIFTFTVALLSAVAARELGPTINGIMASMSINIQPSKMR